jgi:hypothetical protein
MCKSLVEIPYQGLGFAKLTISENIQQIHSIQNIGRKHKLNYSRQAF